VTLGASPDFPPWSSVDGQAAFRHSLPPDLTDLTQIQRQARANYLFIDGHVESLGAAHEDRVYARDRYAYWQR
jgi:prepilin-type processing-associated H-X9-DG protein